MVIARTPPGEHPLFSTMSYSKDTLCWRCKGNSGPSRAFAFWNIQQNERPHRENGRNDENNETNGERKNKDKEVKCECPTQEEEDQKEIVVDTVTSSLSEYINSNDTGMAMICILKTSDSLWVRLHGKINLQYHTGVNRVIIRSYTSREVG